VADIKKILASVSQVWKNTLYQVLKRGSFFFFFFFIFKKKKGGGGGGGGLKM